MHWRDGDTFLELFPDTSFDAHRAFVASLPPNRTLYLLTDDDDHPLLREPFVTSYRDFQWGVTPVETAVVEQLVAVDAVRFRWMPMSTLSQYVLRRRASTDPSIACGPSWCRDATATEHILKWLASNDACPHVPTYVNAYDTFDAWRAATPALPSSRCRVLLVAAGMPRAGSTLQFKLLAQALRLLDVPFQKAGYYNVSTRPARRLDRPRCGERALC